MGAAADPNQEALNSAGNAAQPGCAPVCVCGRQGWGAVVGLRGVGGGGGGVVRHQAPRAACPVWDLQQLLVSCVLTEH